MAERVVSFEFKSKLSTISINVMRLKELWKKDRKNYKKIKKELDKFKRDIKERATLFVMQDPEVSISRAKNIVYLAIDYIDCMLNALDSEEYIEILINAKKEAEALLVFVSLDEGEVSWYA